MSINDCCFNCYNRRESEIMLQADGFKTGDIVLFPDGGYTRIIKNLYYLYLYDYKGLIANFKDGGSNNMEGWQVVGNIYQKYCKCCCCCQKGSR